MDGNTRFELTSASPDSSFAANYQNGPRGYSAPALGRSSSFREGTESRNFGAGKANSRGSATLSGDAPTLSQCLMLEPIVMGEPKHARSGDLKRVLGFSVGSNSEENSFSFSHLKNPSPMVADELRRVRASVFDTGVKASGRKKIYDEHLSKLNKYSEAMPSKKQLHRNEVLMNERSCGPTLKIGAQMHRNSLELGSQKFEDRPKSVGLNKRVRTSMAENRAECRNNGVLRQHLMVTKERDLLKDTNADSDMVEEKIRRLPAGGEGWDKKMKRRRSVGAFFSRSPDNDGEMKRPMHNKISNESSSQCSDQNHGFRSGASGGNSKLDPAPSPARANSKNEQEKSMLARDLSTGPIKERTLGKVNVKLNSREDNPVCPNPTVKGKSSRAPRSGSIVAPNSAANSPRASGTLESWEQPQGARIPPLAGANSRKRAMPSGSSSPPITQWVGQRQQKSSRTRRTNLITVSNHDETQMQSGGCSPSDFCPQISIGGTNASLISKPAATGNQNFKVKTDNVPSPARLSESEESGAGEIRINDKVVDSVDGEEMIINASQTDGSSVPMKKTKSMVKEEIGDGVRRQWRSGRVSPFSRTSNSSMSEKLDDVVPTKPLRNARTGPDKNGSKSGRPLKKLSDRKGFSRLGHMANGGSPDCNGESDDDREALLTASNLAFTSSVNACSSTFWKRVEAFFACLGPDEQSYLSEQLKLAEESCGSPSQNCSNGISGQVKLDDYRHEEMTTSDSNSCRSNRCMKNGGPLNDSSSKFEFAEQLHNSSLYGCSDAEKRFDTVTPLYQRVLSALIMEDEIEECEETGFGRPWSSVDDSCLPIAPEGKGVDVLDFYEPVFDVQTRKNGNVRGVFSCNGNVDIDRSSSARDHLCNGELLQRSGGYLHTERELLAGISRYDFVQLRLQSNNGIISSCDCKYEQMSFEEKLIIELKSIGLFLEAVPALDDKEDEVFNREITQLENVLLEQTGKKKSSLDNICKTIQEGRDATRDPEQVAMDKLVELAYKKLLATRGSFASKHGIVKVSKQAALAFAKRTLARCQKFEDSKASCFSEPGLQEIIYAVPPRFAEKELLSGVKPRVTNDGSSQDAFGTSIPQRDQVVSKMGPISNRGKKKEVLLDDVGGSMFRPSTAPSIVGGAKGKRSERDASGKNAVAKAERLSLGGSKGERKAKSKPKQKIAQLYPSANGSGETAINSGSRKKDVRFMASSGNGPRVASEEMKESRDFANLPLNDIDGIEELGVDSETGAPQDFNSWFNFDVDGLQDQDLVGLQIPMDDLADLF